VLGLERIFKETLSKVRCKFQQCIIEISSHVKSIVAITSLKEESTVSNRAFYLLTLMLLVSLIFLAPDRILQTLPSTPADTGVLEKAQEITKIIKKLIPNL